MPFQSSEFVVFWLVLLAVLLASRRRGVDKIVLLVASLVFCGWSSAASLVPLSIATIATFAIASRLSLETVPVRRKAWLVTGVGVNLALLAGFKYSSGWVDRALPIGISFYTIQAIGYAIDVYRRPSRATASLPDFALFLAFFPRLAAGPILRSAAFMPQLATPAGLQFDRETLFLFLGGLVKKSLIADNLSPCVDGVFANPGHWPNPVVWLAVVAYTVQAYCDFSGYTDMAIALSRVLGYRLPPNFDFPFFARNPPDFWRRWHISLSSWVRDYVFASLPGDPQSKAARWRNTLLMMLAFGLWHGAAWTFVVWGLVHGAMLVAYDAYGTLRRRLQSSYRPAVGPLATAMSIIVMQFCVVIAMIPFRAPDLATAGKVLEKFVLYDVNFSFVGAGLSDIQASRAAILIVVFAVLHAFAYRAGRLERRLADVPAPLAFAGCFALGFAAYFLWPLEEPAFIYLRF